MKRWLSWAWILPILFALCLTLSACRSNACRSCGDKATYKTPDGLYCEECYQRDVLMTCSSCGASGLYSASYYQGKYYCPACAYRNLDHTMR